MTVFQHSPLRFPDSEIRLLVLQPGKKYSSVHCQLTSVASASPRQYEALSYCWGRTVATNTIFVNGKSLQVSPNLEHALRDLRLEGSRPRTLWVDAVCINQTDIPEKNKQLRRMKSIYENASRVLIWIGRDHEVEDEKLKWSPVIWHFDCRGQGSKRATEDAFLFARKLSWLLQLRQAPTLSEKSFANEIIKEPEHYANLSRLLRREWFQRLWTIQEVVVAKKAILICGTQFIPWKVIENAAQCILALLPTLLTSELLYFVELGHERVKRIAECSAHKQILPLLYDTQANQYARLAIQCTDPRDRLFALMALAEDIQDIEVDYSRDYKAVYQAWATRRITRTGTLDILSICADSAQYGLPSWVPDLTHQPCTDRPLFAITHSITPYPGAPPPSTVFCASGPAPGIFRFSETQLPGPSSLYPVPVLKPTLSVLAFYAETIHHLSPIILGSSPAYLDMFTGAGLHDCMAEIESYTIFSAATYHRRHGANAVPLSVLYNEFATALFRGYEHPNIHVSCAARYEFWRGRSSTSLTTFDPASFSLTSRDGIFSAYFEKILLAFLEDCRVLVTGTGGFGVVAGNCNGRAGDEIFVLRGAKTPVVLRRVGDGDGGEYRVMGPCYLYGAMEGERVVGGWDGNGRDGKIREINVV